ncbi:MAG: zinc ribbon domain-containing protein [Prevotella sp.]|nr:zinc ribbon domain-containing protein [Prevotella sp.]
MKCPICNFEVSEEATFCSRCGTKIDKIPQQPMGYDDNTRVVYNPEPQTRGSNNGVLYGIVGFLVAAVIGLGIWLLVRGTSDTEQPQTAQVAQTAAPQTTPQTTDTQQSAAQTQPAVTPAPRRTYSIQGQHRMRGSISKYPITMEIYVSGTQVSGTYYYHSQGSSNRMTVDGYINGSYMVLEEYAPSGLNTGYFHGDFNGYSYSGQFTNYSKQSNLSFSLTEI